MITYTSRACRAKDHNLCAPTPLGKCVCNCHQPQRACADCFHYASAPEMKEQTDGRVICAKCVKRIKDASARRAQLGFFGQQSFI
jgi:hypothetical protein